MNFNSDGKPFSNESEASVPISFDPPKTVSFTPPVVPIDLNNLDLARNGFIPSPASADWTSNAEIVYTTIAPTPKLFGWWYFGGDGSCCVPRRTKLTEEQIKNTEETFGWKWIPNEAYIDGY